MDLTGSARSLANKLVGLIGSKFAVLAVVLPCLLMTYGGISLFVVVFVIYPMGYAIYREADLPRTLLPGAIAFGAFGITMTAIPGTPQIQNIIPTEYYGTTAAAAPVMGIVAALAIGVPGYLYLQWRVRQARKKGLHFVEDEKHQAEEARECPKWHWLCGLLPLVVVVLMLNVLPNALRSVGLADWNANQSIVVALLGGIFTVCLMNIGQAKQLFPAINQGATGSASGGMSIALEALAPQYLEKAAQIGMNPEYLHRVASLASGGLDTLPHNGAVLTLLAVSNCKHKESYLDVCVTSCIIPVVVSLLLSLVWGIF